jgi:hypothetical protein
VTEIPLDDLHDRAVVRASTVPELRRSMRGAAGNLVGAFGELVAMRYMDMLGVGYVDVAESHREWDLVTVAGTVDVKTKERTVPPAPNFDCTVPAYAQGVALPDWYLFVSLMSDGSKGVERFVRGWVLGSISRLRFDEVAVRWEPGQQDRNGWSATIACANVPVSSLAPPKVAVS